jgi:EAL domain-containing protein (putative c-di-GMP-specific phosphodiesterase class I)
LDAFLHRLQQTIRRSRRHRQHQSALLLFSVTGKTKAKTLQEKLNPLTRFEDTIAALPENRIAVILEDFSHISDPLRVANRLREAAGKSADEVSIVLLDGVFEKAEDCFEAAVKTLSNGRPTYHGKEADEQAQSRIQLEADLDDALEKGNLVSHYQPIFNLRHGKLTGFEALVRWEHPKHGLLLPGAFLDIAERRGQLLRIDELVLKQALEQIPIWNAVSERPIYVSANLASDHFLKADNLTALIETLNAHPKALELLRIDVSEQVLFDQEGIDSLNTLDMLRIGFNLDDFGVDSESFHCLGSFPFNSLKIDRTLICQMEDEVNAELIVAVLRIAKRMGMKTIAEGVVTHAQLEELRNLGCTEAQGFLFSEAVPLAEASELINHEYRW